MAAIAGRVHASYVAAYRAISLAGLVPITIRICGRVIRHALVGRRRAVAAHVKARIRRPLIASAELIGYRVGGVIPDGTPATTNGPSGRAGPQRGEGCSISCGPCAQGQTAYANQQHDYASLHDESFLDRGLGSFTACREELSPTSFPQD